ncbi:MAG: CocE/NonD family hydrolase [Acidobacteria bacterium]|nr:MAG: CocE/NonD family hydrolase [Acidobacteriota bacterium]
MRAGRRWRAPPGGRWEEVFPGANEREEIFPSAPGGIRGSGARRRLVAGPPRPSYNAGGSAPGRGGKAMVRAGTSCFACLAACLAVLPAAAEELSGTVTSEETGQPLAGVTVGVTRASSTGGIGAGEAIPVEWTAATDADGNYRFDLDPGLPGMDRLYVFTNDEAHFNELYDAVDTSGLAPKGRDLGEPGVRTVDLTAGPATGIDFQIASSRRFEMVLMRDGTTHLATDVWLPSRRPGLVWPTLLQRTPYQRPDAPPRRFVAADYAVVIQNTRGRFESEGVDDVFDDDGWLENQDGYDTVEWIAAQSFSDGQVGTYGGSAPGITQYLVAGAAPPHLVCAVAEVATADFYHHMNYPGGEFRKHMVETWLAGQGSLHKLDEIFAHPDEDQYWDERNLMNRLGSVRIPILHIGGWYDIFSQGTVRFFHALQHQGGEGARLNQKLVVGPWTHGAKFSPWQGELTYPLDSIFSDYDDFTMRWYDFWLKGKDTGIMDEPPARYYVMGPGLPEGAGAPGNFWRHAPDWPPPATPVRYYLHPGGVLSTDPPPPGGGETIYVHDPNDPVPTRGGSNLYEDIGKGPMDQRPVDDARADVVVWQTPPLAQPLEISGPITAVLYAASDRPDTDWVVKLEDVYPDGRAMLVTDLILMARHRISFRQEDLLAPGQVYRFEVDLWDTSITFPAGHAIRIAVASSNYPRFEVNPQTGEPFHQHTHTEVATNRIEHSATEASYVELPVVDPAEVTGCRPSEHVLGLMLRRLPGGEIELRWDPVSDACHARYKVYAGLARPEWPWIVRRPIAATEQTTLVTDAEGLFWQVVSQGTDGGNGPHGVP